MIGYMSSNQMLEKYIPGLGIKNIDLIIIYR